MRAEVQAKLKSTLAPIIAKVKEQYDTGEGDEPGIAFDEAVRMFEEWCKDELWDKLAPEEREDFFCSLFGLVGVHAFSHALAERQARAALGEILGTIAEKIKSDGVNIIKG